MTDIGDLTSKEYDQLIALITQALAEADRFLGRAVGLPEEYRSEAVKFLAVQRALAFHLAHR